ncbi:hypothetical protein [Lacrimispora sp.]|uniref:hypothetical protein n=1 Tax=Lacrimispora sp. TaxID=2719234 RepID=UPI0028AB7D74|nr:hypothetical protein [Lacrimispora sp.]
MTVEQIELRKILSQMLADNGINRKCNRIIGIKPSFHWSFERRKVMKRQIRRGVFETNSSSTHSLTMCSEEEFEK